MTTECGATIINMLKMIPNDDIKLYGIEGTILDFLEIDNKTL
jgi:hypothetical protein